MSDSPAPDTQTVWRCNMVRSHGVCNSFNAAEEKSCGACGEDRPPRSGEGDAATPPEQWPDQRHAVIFLEDVTKALRWECTLAKSALENWGKHHDWCASRAAGTSMACDCGLVVAIARIPTTSGSVPSVERGSGEAPSEEARPRRRRNGRPLADDTAPCPACGETATLISDLVTSQWGSEATAPSVTVQTWYYRCACGEEWYTYDLSMRDSANVLKATVQAQADELTRLRSAHASLEEKIADMRRVILRRHQRLAEAVGDDPGFSVDMTIDHAIERIRAHASRESEVVWLRALFDTFGQHHLDCPAHPLDVGEKCNCGYDAALDAMTEEPR